MLRFTTGMLRVFSSVALKRATFSSTFIPMKRRNLTPKKEIPVFSSFAENPAKTSPFAMPEAVSLTSGLSTTAFLMHWKSPNAATIPLCSFTVRTLNLLAKTWLELSLLFMNTPRNSKLTLKIIRFGVVPPEQEWSLGSALSALNALTRKSIRVPVPLSCNTLGFLKFTAPSHLLTVVSALTIPLPLTEPCLDELKCFA